MFSSNLFSKIFIRSRHKQLAPFIKVDSKETSLALVALTIGHVGGLEHSEISKIADVLSEYIDTSKLENAIAEANSYVRTCIKSDLDISATLIKAISCISRSWDDEEKHKIVNKLLDIAFADGKLEEQEALYIYNFELKFDVTIDNVRYLQFMDKMHLHERLLSSTHLNDENSNAVKEFFVTYKIKRKRNRAIPNISWSAKVVATSESRARKVFKATMPNSKNLAISKVEEV